MGYLGSFWVGPHFLPTLSIEFQVAYVSSIATDDDSTSKDAVSRSVLRSGNNPIMCDGASEEVLETSGRIMTLHGLIVDAGCINSNCKLYYLVRINAPILNFGSFAVIFILQLYFLALIRLIKPSSTNTTGAQSRFMDR